MTSSSKETRTLLLTLREGTELPEGLTDLLEDEAVAAGVLRGHGVLVDASIRVHSPLGGALGTVRTLVGESQLVVLDGSIGMAGGHPIAELRAVLARETDLGVETVAGSLVAGRVLRAELVILALDDVAVALDPNAPPPPRASAPQLPFDRASEPRAIERAVERAPSPWADAVKASAAAPAQNPKSPPKPPLRAAQVEDDTPFPDHGDLVDHFAFGNCEVLKGDGDRIHVKVGKDGRIREIALEMLKVTLKSEPDERPRRFRLERKL